MGGQGSRFKVLCGSATSIVYKGQRFEGGGQDSKVRDQDSKLMEGMGSRFDAGDQASEVGVKIGW